MKIAKLDQNGLALEEGFIRVYNVNPINNEYLDFADEFLMLGVDIPQYSYVDQPLVAKAGFAVCRQGEQWQYVADKRGQTVYCINTLQEKTMTELGEIPADFTLLKPQTRFDRWDGTQWVTDLIAKQQAEIQAANQQRQQLDDEAKEMIIRLTDAIELGIALATDEQNLIEWRKYRVLLGRVNTAGLEDIRWPVKPN